MRFRPLHSPLLSIFAIVCWWLIAFKSPEADEPHYAIDHPQASNSGAATSCLLKERGIIALNRDTIAKALKGDVALMGKLILDWNMDADIIELQSSAPVKRLDKETLVRSQILARILTESNKEELSQRNEEFRKKLVIDDTGYPINLENPPRTFLPQTYMFAEILLSLVEPSQIVALPAGFLTQKTLFDSGELSSIELLIDRYSTEKLYLAAPDIALVAQSFSHPSTIEAMKTQGIELYTTTNIYSVDDIKRTVEEIGHIANEPLKGELLSIFIEAAFNAIDNKRNIDFPDLSSERILVVSYHSQFSLPGKKTFTTAMLQRMGLHLQNAFREQLANDNDWSVPICEEKIYAFDPKFLLVITAACEGSQNYFSTIPAFQSIRAENNGSICVLDEQIQRTVSQQIVLAYYDLNNALVKLDE